ncbi:hypothetical protein LTR70_007569 [Exophiala xenobiotica]|uniref:Uncharacterized protein n=1 Tax=Lithohypha guttulata TaxID=1690604 RepID=A0ABR0JXX1_9EURO|nr:hypothetical protein LTR24_009271 [Lithohypha guttulata]KAK5313584.1 hypothetical protein LTR70_007569 [Exophiala xenobiotica]
MSKRQDVVELLERHHNDGDQLEKFKTQYKGLIDQKSLKLKLNQYHLVFDDEDLDDEKPLSLTTPQLQYLVGKDWKAKKDKFLKNKDTKPRILGRNCRLQLNHLPPELCLNGLDILAQDKGIKIQNITAKTVKVSPVVVLAITLSLQACEKRRGLFLWQRKLRRGPTASAAKWASIPDLLLVDYRWGENESVTFLKATYERMREFLNADTRIEDCEPVLPFAVDFPGTAQKRGPLTTEPIDGEGHCLAAISIPNAGYIGWINEMKQQSTPSADIRFDKVESMYDRAMSMFHNHITGSIMLYEWVQDRLQDAIVKEDPAILEEWKGTLNMVG